MEEKRTNNTKKGILIVCCVAALLLIGFLGSYAYFMGNLGSNKQEEVSTQAGTLALTFADGNNGITQALEFGGSIEKTFSIENTGSLDATARIMWDDLVNTYLDGSLTYTLSSSDTETGTYTNIVENQNVPVTNTSTKELLAGNLSIPTGSTKYYKLTITLNYLDDVDQTADLKASLSTHFSVEESDGKDVLNAGIETTLAKIGKETKSSVGLNFAEPATTNETEDGLYSLEDDYGTSYFYRGAVEDNYVKFGKWSINTPDKYYGHYSNTNVSFREYSTLSECQNASNYNTNCTLVSRAGKPMYWRIIRVNGDGSVRMIYDGTSAHLNGDVSTDRVAWPNQKFNSLGNDAKYVGYMYGPANEVEGTTTASTDKAQAQTNTASSDIKIKLEEWYAENLISEDVNIADSIFCYDRSLESRNSGTGYGMSLTYYGARGRTGVANGSVSPKFNCENKNDAFTKSDTEKGNGALSQKVGLVTADEVVAVGSGKYSTSNIKYYLFKGISYWTSTPMYYNSLVAYIFEVSGDGSLSGEQVDYVRNVVPVISLTPEYFATLIGDGTIGNPFREAE